MAAPIVKLCNGLEMPIFGLGTMLARDDVGIQAVKDAIDAGYRHFDTAFIYRNEKQVGAGIQAKIAEGVVRREDIFIVTKLWNTYHDPDKVEVACRNSLDKLGLGYIDLYLMHTPMGWEFRGHDDSDIIPKNDDGSVAYSDVDYVDTYKAMEKLVDIGLVRSLGVSNFNSVQIDRLLSTCRIKPVTNQVECSPTINQKKLIEFCKERDIIITAYSPLGRPYSRINNPDEPKLVFLDPKVQAIGEKYGKTAVQVILRYLIQLGTVPIPKSSNKERIQQNITIFDFILDEDDIKVMDSFHTGDCSLRRFFTQIKAHTHKYYPFNIEF